MLLVEKPNKDLVVGVQLEVNDVIGLPKKQVSNQWGATMWFKKGGSATEMVYPLKQKLHIELELRKPKDKNQPFLR
jgi:hypothetical protein